MLRENIRRAAKENETVSFQAIFSTEFTELSEFKNQKLKDQKVPRLSLPQITSALSIPGHGWGTT
jgi:hypothetical protein